VEGCYREAAEHLLSALAMHGGGGGSGSNVSRNLWDTLRRTFVLMDRGDLCERALAKQDVEQFRNDFEFGVEKN